MFYGVNLGGYYDWQTKKKSSLRGGCAHSSQKRDEWGTQRQKQVPPLRCGMTKMKISGGKIR